MAKVAIQWIPWLKQLKKWQLWLLAVLPAIPLVVLLVLRLKNLNSSYDPNWFGYLLALYYALAFCPFGEQIQYLLVPQSQPHHQYQVTTWNQWVQAMLIAFVILIFSLLFWLPQKQGEIAIHVMAAVVLGFCIMWSYRFYGEWRRRRQGQNK
ncbi:hypothetical protein PT274_02710 [Leuconostocaceae bacterium ESL0958]|nr:hypothetical protein [Leuconostocaceae bacterium ESL0958]